MGEGGRGRKREEEKNIEFEEEFDLKLLKKKKKELTSEYKILNFPAEIRRDINCGFLLQGINETLLFTGKVKCTRLLKSAHGVSTG